MAMSVRFRPQVLNVSLLFFMRRIGSTIHINSVIESIMRSSPHKNKISSVLLHRMWCSVMPSCVASRTSKVTLKHDKLFVKVLSPSLKYELNSAKSSIIDKIKEQRVVSSVVVGDIKDLVFL
jgi:hypothetical protein